MSKVIFLGTGSSPGVPEIGCKCKVCLSNLDYNKRLRPSVLIKKNSKNILIDPSPDFRLQALKHKINRIDAILITHIHFDHIAGLDDLRALNRLQKEKLRLYLSKNCFIDIKNRYEYLFLDNSDQIESAKFDFHILENHEGSFDIDGIKISYFKYHQNKIHEVLGYRIDDLAYITDIKIYNDNIFKFLKNINTLILSCLRYEKSTVHFNVEEAISFAKKVNANISYFTHMAHEIDYETLSKELSKNMKLAYDNLEIEF
jgi:phosphoribosyl 1,2-cyclic phosphate phosphodiesterase